MAGEQGAALRISFVEMLFALTIAEVAVQVANIVTQGTFSTAFLPAYSHLALATAIVATSWIGWSTSKAPGAEKRLDKVFSFAYVVLSVDVLLVIFYFIIVRGVDIDNTGGNVRPNPSTSNETLWVLLIFAVYFGWDVLTKIMMVSDKTPSLTVRERILSPSLGGRALRTAVCLGGAALVWLLLRARTDILSVILVDASLISLVFLFRALKQPHIAWTWGLSAAFVAFTALALAQ